MSISRRKCFISGKCYQSLQDGVHKTDTDFEHLHEVRIVGKQLRYAMEIFAECFAPEFRGKLYPEVEAMQEILGNANDSYVASKRLDALSQRLPTLVPAEWKRYRSGIESLVRFH